MSASNLGSLSSPTGVSIIKATFTGSALAGPVNVPGVKAGDIVLTVYNETDANYPVGTRVFRSVAPADDVLFQGPPDLDTETFVAILLRP